MTKVIKVIPMVRRPPAPLPVHLRAEAERIARTYPNGDTKRAPLPVHLR